MIKLPIGISDFKNIRENKLYYADKTLMVEELMAIPSATFLLPRPRRFGKTLNMSMLYYFFDVLNAERNRPLFEGLQVEKSEAWKHFGKYPTIFLTLKDVKEDNINKAIENIGELCSQLVERHLYLLKSEKIPYKDKAYIQKVYDEETTTVELQKFLKKFSHILYKYYEQSVIIMIDEYDSSIISAWVKGYHKEMIDFMKNFLSGGFKDNTYLAKGIITGILRVAKENIFSGLNNTKTYTILSTPFANKFGFTKEEVKELLAEAELQVEFENLATWYNGYTFGKVQNIYNPWSVLNYIQDYEDGFRPYWANTSSNELVRHLIENATAEMEEVLTKLLNNEPVSEEIAESTIFEDLERGKVKTVLGLLLFNGYLTSESSFMNEDDRFEHSLKIPNKEVGMIYREMIANLLTKSDKVNSSMILTSLLEQNGERFEIALSHYLLSAFSYHDIGSGDYPEKVYHAFILGIMAHLTGKYIIKSNPETGLGRADLVIVPKDSKDKKGWILEFKRKYEGERIKLDVLAQKALKQIKESKYITLLEEHGKTDLMLMGIAFDGKEVCCETEILR